MNKERFAFIILIGLGLMTGWLRGECIMLINSFESQEDVEKITPHDASVSMTTDAVTDGKKALAVDFAYTNWPNIYFKIDQAFTDGDWKKFGGLAVDITNPQDEPVKISIRIDDDFSADGSKHCQTGRATLPAGKKSMVLMPFGVSVPKGMRGGPGLIPEALTMSAGGAELDWSNIVAFQIFLPKPEKAYTLIVDNIRLLPKMELKGIVDQYGQFTWKDWPGKIHSDEELQQRYKEETSDISTHPAPADRDRFGGWKTGPHLKATGRFYVTKYQGKWWFVDPDGYLFWSSGIDCVRYTDSTSVEGRENLFAWLPGAKDDFVLQAGAKITTDKNEVISGAGSLKVDTLESSGEWNEFFRSVSKALPLKPKGTYTVYFKYKILDKKADCRFYFLVRSTTAGAPSPADKGWTDIKDEPGTSTTKTITFTLDDYNDYYLIFGIYKKGALVIDDIKVFEGNVGEKEIEKASPVAHYKFESERLEDPFVKFGDGRTYDFSQANLFRKYGEEYKKRFLELATKRLLSWGFNTIGNWSDADCWRLKQVPYTIPTGASGAPTIVVSKQIVAQLEQKRTFPDVFNPAFGSALEKKLKELAEFKDDPWLLGVFIDNELPWVGWGKGKYELAMAVLASDSKYYIKRAAADYLKEQFGTVDKLNNVWGTNIGSWDEALAPLNLNTEQKQKAESEFAGITKLVAKQYFSACKEMMNRHLPGVLYLGCRFSDYNREIVEVAKEYCDVVSFNIYGELPTEGTRGELATTLDFPVVIGEFHFGALDRGMFHTGVRSAKDQNERAEKFGRYLSTAYSQPWCVGAHWFRFVDQPLTGRFDGENYNIGFLMFNDTPYPEMRETARRVNAELYRIRSK